MTTKSHKTNPADKVEQWPIEKLVLYAKNSRTHSEEQVAQIAASIKEWGFTTAVLVDESGSIIAGHGRGRLDRCPEAPSDGLNERRDMTDANAIQYGGTHYKNKAVQPWDYIAANGLGYFEGNVVKYVSRWRDKGGIDDLHKARHYLDKLIELARGGE